MYSNQLFKILCSIPAIIVVGYFIPFVAICLIFARFFIYGGKKIYSTIISLLTIGLLILIPKVVSYIIENSYLKSINDSNEYINILNYSKFLIGTGIILLVLYFVFKKLIDKLANYLRTYIAARQSAQDEISRKNDLVIKLKQEKSKTTRVVICSHCGADNTLTEKTGHCSFCRRKLN